MKHNQVRQIVFPLLTALIWGTSFVAQDVCSEKMGAMTFNAVRSYIAVIALLLIIFIFGKLKKDKPQLTTEQKKHGRKQLWIGGFCCGTALAVGANLQQAGLGAGTDAGKAGFITALYIVLVPIFGLFFKKKVSLPVWISVALAVIALYLLCVNGALTIAYGDLLMLLCAAFFAIHILVIDHFTQFVDGMKLSCIQFLVAGTWSFIGMLIFEQPDWSAVLSCALPILYVGIFSSGVAYTLQIVGQKDVEPTIASMILSLESAISALAGWVILGQKLSLKQAGGCVLVFAAIMLVQLPERQKAK